MKTNIIALTVFTLILGFAAAIYAWGGGHGHRGGNHYGTERGYGYGWNRGISAMEKELNLTKKQVSVIEKIRSDFQNRYERNRGNSEKMHALWLKHRKAVEKVLTREQLKKFRSNDSYCRNYMHPGQGQGRGWHFRGN